MGREMEYEKRGESDNLERKVKKLQLELKEWKEEIKRSLDGSMGFFFLTKFLPVVRGITINS